MSPVKKLEPKVIKDKDFPGGVYSLPEKEEIIEKINEIILFINELEIKLNNILK